MPSLSRIAALVFSLLVGAAVSSPRAASDSTDGWSYGYDSLLRDLRVWKNHRDVRLDSIGATLRGRAIWMVTISDSTDSLGADPLRDGPKKRVVFHARTHPAEVQSQRIANEAIRFLLDSGELAGRLRREFLFHVVPMYNPDGVEMGLSRWNANGIDLESNWNKPALQPETKALKARFEQMMAGTIPVEVALNLHSDRLNCTRFFFMHDVGGTSSAFVELEKKFIAGVQAHARQGWFEDWDFIQSWVEATGTQYPEGFWWINHREDVMAMTYEDANCTGADGFDTTARALVLGAADYAGAGSVQVGPRARPTPKDPEVVFERSGIRIAATGRAGVWEIRDASGRRILSGKVGLDGAFVPWRKVPATTGFVVVRGKSSIRSVRLPPRF